MLPKGVILKTEKSILYWKNVTFHISVDEAQIISQEIRNMLKNHGIKAILVDNRHVGGAWPADVNPIWSELMTYLMTMIDKCATIASPVVVMQINRLSKHQGTFEKIQAFSELAEALHFIGVSDLSVLQKYVEIHS